MPVAPSSSFPIPVAVDLDFRPDTYVADWCALAATLQNVTGDRRRREAHDRWLNRARAGGLMPRHLADTLDGDERDAYVAEDPAVRCAGEYLPAYLPGELEIARIVIETRPRIVYSLRARSKLPIGRRPHFGRGTHLTYEERRALRMVDEHGTQFDLPSEHQMGTFSLRELIRFIDGVRASTVIEHPAHVPFPEALVLEAAGLNVPTAQMPRFVQVSSTVYPELLPFYRDRLTWWTRRHFTMAERKRPVHKVPEDTLLAWWREGSEATGA